MSILSGLATAPGTAPLLNAPRDANPDLRVDAAPPGRAARATDEGRTATARDVPRPVVELMRARAAPALGRDPAAQNGYARFIDAVLALRLDSDLSPLPPGRMAAVREAGRSVFGLDDGTPGPVRPDPGALPDSSALSLRAGEADAPDNPSTGAETTPESAPVAEPA